MASLTDAIRYFVSTKIDDINYDKKDIVQRYLVLDKPVMTVTEICKEI